MNGKPIGFKEARPKIYLFTPRDNMTPVESAWCAHFFAWRIGAEHVDPDTYLHWGIIARHFTDITPPGDAGR